MCVQEHTSVLSSPLSLDGDEDNPIESVSSAFEYSGGISFALGEIDPAGTNYALTFLPTDQYVNLKDFAKPQAP